MSSASLRARYIGSKMGLAWSYINPLVRFLTSALICAGRRECGLG